MLKWTHVFGEMDMHIWLCKDTGTMNRPLRLAECSQPISWVTPPIHGVFRGCFVVCSWIFHRVFAALLQFVRHIIIICVMRNEKPFATSSPLVRHPFCEYAMRHRKLGVTCLFCGCYVFRKQKGGFYVAKTPFLHAKNPLFARQKPYF